ncbi:MAG: endolytic transglycosylase MltG, partial [Desulfobacteraceae bacterium]|nr:endolytic transglycosylase MltG [Desulfobacteraceae bacterium]
VGRFIDVWKGIKISMDGREMKFSLHQMVTLASIVEKETGAATERPRIASVFINRLTKGMPLQSDPTVIYGIENFSGDIKRRDLRTKTAYNTYVIPALPVGPICNPGKDSMVAVLKPAKEKYFYFVSKNNGTHHFSKSLKEHNRAVWKYQKNRKK